MKKSRLDRAARQIQHLNDFAAVLFGFLWKLGPFS